MGSLFSRNSFAKRIKVSPPRISQMLGTGEIAKPEIQLDEKTFAWPASYVEAYAAERSGRKVSGSIYGFLPPAKPAIEGEVALVEHEGIRCFAQKFTTESGCIVLATLLSRNQKNNWPGMAPLPAEVAHTGTGEMVKLFEKVADEMLNGDLFSVSWVWLKWGSFSPTKIQEVVIIDEGDSSRESSRYDTQKKRYRTEFSDLSFEAIAGKLGRPVPAFPSRLATPEVVEQWLAGGRVSPTEVFMDTTRFEQYAAAAALIRNLPDRDLNSSQRSVLGGVLTRTIRWEESGQLEEGFSEPDVWPDSADYVSWHAIARQPDFARFREASEGNVISIESVDDEQGQEILDSISELLEHRYGPYGKIPDASVASALSVASGCLRSDLRLRPPHRNFMAKQYKVFRSFHPKESKAWTMFCAGLTKWHGEKTSSYRELDTWEVDGESKGHRQIRADSQGNPVLITRIQNPWGVDANSEIDFAIAAVPVVGKDSPADLGRDFTEIIVVPNTQNGPVLIQTPRGLQLMPVTYEDTEAYTHGYSGTGPSNLTAAIGGFLEWVAEAELTAIGKDRLRAIVLGTDQYEHIHASRENILGPGTTLSKTK